MGKHGGNSFPGHGQPHKGSDLEEEVRRLQKELRNTQEERDIKKKHWPSYQKIRGCLSGNARDGWLSQRREDVPALTRKSSEPIGLEQEMIKGNS